jgi:hypothetical protein
MGLLGFFCLDAVMFVGVWLVACRIWLDLPAAAVAVTGEHGSGSWRRWGAAPVDVRSLLASSRP